MGYFMNILIDGYNLIKQLIATSVTEKERSWFQQRCAEYARKKGHKIIIVYDAGPYTRMTKINEGRVTTIFSGHKDTADDVIKDYIDRKLLKNMLLVTTDRALNKYADQFDVPSIDSLDFYEFMKSDGARQVVGFRQAAGKPEKLNPENENPDLDRLMEEGTTVLQYKRELEEDDDETYDFSKSERRLMGVIKKL